jgi:hypothetical protein
MVLGRKPVVVKTQQPRKVRKRPNSISVALIWPSNCWFFTTPLKVVARKIHLFCSDALSERATFSLVYHQCRGEKALSKPHNKRYHIKRSIHSWKEAIFLMKAGRQGLPLLVVRWSFKSRKLTHLLHVGSYVKKLKMSIAKNCEKKKGSTAQRSISGMRMSNY